MFRGKPTVLVTSAEHYGAVLNSEFDYVEYLDELSSHGLNHTRTFTGVYCEPQGAFNIAKNTLAPAAGALICPWARSEETGYANGGNKFDLTEYDPAYFDRLKDFVAQAHDRGIVVELVLFCPFYEDSMWRLSPMNAANNVSGVGDIERTGAYTLDEHGGLLPYHEAVTRKIVTELNEFDNLYYEICNEPYFGGVTMEWQHRIIDVIVDTEKTLTNEHLVSLNIANGKSKVANPHPAVSLFNFHYADPPETVRMNYDLHRAIGDNETGFKGQDDTHYRREGWRFILAGGALFSHLDYSFAVGHEDGSFDYPAKQPGGGNDGFREQMSVLCDFVHSFDFWKMRPDRSVVKGGVPEEGSVKTTLVSVIKGRVPKRGSVEALVEPGRQYAIYVAGGGPVELAVEMPEGEYRVEWVDVLSGTTTEEAIDHRGSLALLKSPMFEEDIALRIKRR